MDNTANFNENALSKEKKEALNIFNPYGKSSRMQKIDWRGWQKQLREYLNKPIEREIIWNIGKKEMKANRSFKKEFARNLELIKYAIWKFHTHLKTYFTF